ncbi:unnamed protein product, partial [Rotaria magnacalcarata]
SQPTPFAVDYDCVKQALISIENLTEEITVREILLNEIEELQSAERE